MTNQQTSQPTPDPATLKAEREAHSTKTVEMRARAERFLSIDGWSRRDALEAAEDLARDVLELTAPQAETEPDENLAKSAYAHWYSESALWEGTDYLWLNRFRATYSALRNTRATNVALKEELEAARLFAGQREPETAAGLPAETAGE